VPSGSHLRHVDGDRLGGPPDGVTLPPLEPGSVATVSVPMTAPTEPGTYTSYWRASDADGRRFGHRLWAQIVVTQPQLQSSLVIDSFTGEAKAAEDFEFVNSSSPTSAGNALDEAPPLTESIAAALADAGIDPNLPTSDVEAGTVPTDDNDANVACVPEGAAIDGSDGAGAGDGPEDSAALERERLLTKWAPQLGQLASMGFLETDRILEILEEQFADGDSDPNLIERLVPVLLGS